MIEGLIATYKVRTGRYDAIAALSLSPKALLDMEEVFFHLPT
jgi:hypothetical protein